MWKHSTTAIYVIAVTGAPGLFTKKIRRSQHPSVHGMRKYQWEAAKRELNASMNIIGLLNMKLEKEERWTYCKPETTERSRKQSQKSPQSPVLITAGTGPSFSAHASDRGPVLFYSDMDFVVLFHPSSEP
jgi:hypothetical protein